MLLPASSSLRAALTASCLFVVHRATILLEVFGSGGAFDGCEATCLLAVCFCFHCCSCPSCSQTVARAVSCKVVTWLSGDLRLVLFYTSHEGCTFAVERQSVRNGIAACVC